MDAPLKIPEELTSETLEEWSDAVKDHLNLWIFHITILRNEDLVLHSIIVQRDELKQGKGTKAMELLTDLADYHQRKIWLSPGERNSHSGTTSRGRLIKFYKRFGFVRNRGRNKDYRSRETMFRRPMGRGNPTEPLPIDFSGSIALMTKQEFLDFRNPRGKWHGPESYDFDLQALNKNYSLRHMEDYRTDGGVFRIYKTDDNFIIYYSVSDRHRPTDPFKIAIIIHDGILYYSNTSLLHRLPKGYREDFDQETKTWHTRPQWIRFDIKQKLRVKYLDEYLHLIEDAKNRNLQDYTHLHQRIQLRGRSYQIRLREEPRINSGTTIVILNDQGEVVAQASNEWGATLLVVAKEYRGLGLGKIIGRLWYQWNPKFTSGGFTDSGMALATAIWESRVREFRAKGWYSELLRQGHITKLRIKEIFSELREKALHKRLEPKPVEKKIQILIEKDKDEKGVYWGPMFLIYDEAFFDDQDEKYIYGFGFFRDSHVGSFLYTIDYDRSFRKLATYVALQIARNNEEKIYIGEGYGDYLEIEGLDHIRQEGDYIFLTQDVIDLEPFRKVESYIRRSRDSYDQIYHVLLEMAHSKWD